MLKTHTSYADAKQAKSDAHSDPYQTDPLGEETTCLSNFID
jgi:hypothetical protein